LPGAKKTQHPTSPNETTNDRQIVVQKKNGPHTTPQYRPKFGSPKTPKTAKGHITTAKKRKQTLTKNEKKVSARSVVNTKEDSSVA